MSRRSTVVLVSAAVLASLAAAAGAQINPIGAPFDAVSLPGRHESPVAAPGPNGAFRLVWHQPSKGIHEAIWDQSGVRHMPEYLALGAKIAGDPLMLPDETFPELYGSGDLRNRTAPHMTAAAADGTYWAVWTEGTRWVTSGPLHYNAITLDEDVYARRFTFDGRPLGLPFRVDQGGDLRQRAAQVVTRPQGGTLVVWEHGDASTYLEPGDAVKIRAMDANGNGIGPERNLHEDAMMGRGATIALGADGTSALVAWEAKYQAGESTGVWVRTVDPRNGTALSEPMRLDSGYERDQRRASIAALPDGSYLVVWQGATNELVTGYSRNYRTETRARRVGADGEPIGSTMRLSDPNEQQNTAPRVVSLGDGRAFVAWITWGVSVFRPQFVAGVVVDEFGSSPVTELTEGQIAPQNAPALAANGDIVFLGWSAYDDEDKPTVMGRRFRIN